MNNLLRMFVVLFLAFCTALHAQIDSMHYVDMPKDCIVYEYGDESGYYVEPAEYHSELSSNVEWQEVGTTLVVGRKAFDVHVERVFGPTELSNTDTVDVWIYISRHLSSMDVEMCLMVGRDTIALIDTTSVDVLDSLRTNQFAILEMDPTLQWRLHSRDDVDVAAAGCVYASIDGTQASNARLHVRYSLAPRIVTDDWTRSYVYRVAGGTLGADTGRPLHVNFQAESASVLLDTNATGVLFATVTPELSMWQKLVLGMRIPVLLFGAALGVLLFPLITSMQELKRSWTRNSLLLLIVASFGYIFVAHNDVPLRELYDFMDGHYNWRKHLLVIGLAYFGAWVVLILSTLCYLVAWMLAQEGQIQKNRISHELI